MIINLKVQNEADSSCSLIKRGIFDCGRMLTAQYSMEFAHWQYQKVKLMASV